jgi:hypothetical protein
MRKKAKVRLVSDKSEGRFRRVRVSKRAAAIDKLMRSLKHVESSGPHTRDEMNER